MVDEEQAQICPVKLKPDTERLYQLFSQLRGKLERRDGQPEIDRRAGWLGNYILVPLLLSARRIMAQRKGLGCAKQKSLEV